MATIDTDQQLAWEARQRVRAAAAAIVAAVGTFGGALWSTTLLSDLPRATVIEALDLAAQPGPVIERESSQVPLYEAFADRAGSFLLSSALSAVGLLALGWALTYLAVATRARRAELPRFVTYLPMAGGILSALAAVLSTVARDIAIDDFLAGPRSVGAAGEVGGSGLFVTAELIRLPGLLALAAALVLIGLNAMRAGLLTRFMGILGIITGALFIFPLGSPPVVQAFWLVCLGLLFLRRWPGGVPPAWDSGKAEPWPSGAELRRRSGAERPGAPVAAGPAPAPRSSRKRRKR